MLEDNFVTMGITQYAADELTDITYVELPEVGAKMKPGDAIGEVESVKATSEIFTAVGGVVVEVNAALVDHPELINDDAFEEGWIARIRPDSTDPFALLLDAKEYKAFVRNAS
jgi:glycine cleavage system H protein